MAKSGWMAQEDKRDPGSISEKPGVSSSRAGRRVWHGTSRYEREHEHEHGYGSVWRGMKSNCDGFGGVRWACEGRLRDSNKTATTTTSPGRPECRTRA